MKYILILMILMTGCTSIQSEMQQQYTGSANVQPIIITIIDIKF